MKSIAGAVSVQQVGSHLNEKVPDLCASIIAKYNEAPVELCLIWIS